MLDIVASYDCMQFQGKITYRTSENGKKSSFRPNFGLLALNLDCQFDFSQNLAASVTRYYGHLSPSSICNLEKT